MSEGDDPRTRAGEKLVTITAASRTNDVTTVALALESDRWPLEPIAPANLWTDDNKRVAELHKLIRLEGDSGVFESYELGGDPPELGGPYRMITWWTPEQYETATSAKTLWSRATWQQPTPTWDHEHCALTWATIEPGDTVYVNGDDLFGPDLNGDDLLVPDAYEKYIRDDVLRLRRP